jgi:hypothetical protein
MNANELRIGNKALLTDINEICIITWISNKYIGYETKSRIGECIPSCLKPIPLTEEWLLKFGFNTTFEKITEIQINENENEVLYYDISEKCMSLYVPVHYEDTSLIFNHCKYVHQLQNLYFALSGKELVVSDAVS